MSHNYTPAAVALTTIPLPDDGDPRTAASFNAPLQKLADAIKKVGNDLASGDGTNAASIAAEAVARAAADAALQTQINAHDGHTAPIVWNSGTTTVWVAGANDRRVRIDACGGGGQGGGGAGACDDTTTVAQGGGGGGAAERYAIDIDVVPGRSYTFVRAAGGDGNGVGGTGDAAAGNSGTDGADGADSIFKETISGTVLATWKGASGGKGGACVINADVSMAAGGYPVRGVSRPSADTPVFHRNSTYRYGPGFGGDGVQGNNFTSFGGAGFSSVNGFAGGIQGNDGLPDAAFDAGGPGGGGAASFFGVGGRGGAGGNGASGGGGGAGGGPPGGAVGFGAGGGGGGGGGTGSTGGGNGADGQDGGNGFGTLRVIG